MGNNYKKSISALMITAFSLFYTFYLKINQCFMILATVALRQNLDQE